MTLNVKITSNIASPPAVTGYRLYVSENGGAFNIVKTWPYPAGPTSYTHTYSRPFDVEYYVVAYNACGNSAARHWWHRARSDPCGAGTDDGYITTGPGCAP
jgi:hypothetical protein